MVELSVHRVTTQRQCTIVSIEQVSTNDHGLWTATLGSGISAGVQNSVGAIPQGLVTEIKDRGRPDKHQLKPSWGVLSLDTSTAKGEFEKVE